MSSAWAQAPGDIVIIGSSPEGQAELQAYWEQLLKLNAAQKPVQTTEAQPATAPVQVQPATGTQEEQTDISDEEFDDEEFDDDIPEVEDEEADL